MSQDHLIDELKSANLFAECTHCAGEFKLSKAILFDGCGAFPDIAEQKRMELLEGLRQRIDELKKRKISAAVGAEKKAIEVGIGKILEKIVPAYKGFGMPISECRPLFEPLDLIVFSGIGKLNIESVTFLEIKTGNAKLAKHERMIRDAISDRKVTYKVL